MKSRKLSTLKTHGGGGALNSEKIVEKADKNGTFSDLKTEEKPLKKEQKKAKIYALILSIIFLFTALVGGSVFLIVKHISKTNATTESPTITTNIFNKNGTINSTAATALLSAINYWNNKNNTSTYTAHNIAGRTSDNSGSSIIFPMGYVNGTSGNSLYWQATYLKGKYLAVWLDRAYTTSNWNSPTGAVSYNSYATSTIQTYINETFYPLVTQNSSTLKSIFVTPATAGAQTLKSGTSNDTSYWYNSSYTSKFDNMSSTVGNSHYMWLPSFGEVFNNTTSSYTNSTTSYTGQWKLNSTDRAFNRTLYSSSDTTDYCYLRSGLSGNDNIAIPVYYSGVAVLYGIISSYGVRPAAFISLSSLAGLIQYNVSLSTNNSSYGTVSGGGAIKYNTTTTITAMPNTGYLFDYWMVGSTRVESNPYSFTVTADVTCKAYFKVGVLITVASSNSAYGSVSGGGTFESGASVTFTATPNSGYTFAGWSTDGGGTIISTSNILTISATENTTYTAVFLALKTITAISSDEALGSVYGAGEFSVGENVSLIAIINTGAAFLYWVDSSGTTYSNNPLNLTVSEDETYTAYFTDSLLSNIACFAEAGGEVRMNGYTDSDTTIHFSAVAYAGYTFDGWYIYGESTVLSTEWSVDLEKSAINNKLIVAKFSETNAQVNTETNNTGNLT